MGDKTQMEHERWVDIKGFEGLYQVSNMGNVRSVDRLVKQTSKRFSFVGMRKGRLLKQGVLNSGYKVVWLSNGNRKKAFTVHRLVANAFLKNDRNFSDVNHKDGDKTNNDAVNLEWCNRRYNVIHAYKKGLSTPRSRKQIICVELNSEYESVADASRKTGISRCSISHVINGRAKTAGGYTWKAK